MDLTDILSNPGYKINFKMTWAPMIFWRCEWVILPDTHVLLEGNLASLDCHRQKKSFSRVPCGTIKPSNLFLAWLYPWERFKAVQRIPVTRLRDQSVLAATSPSFNLHLIPVLHSHAGVCLFKIGAGSWVPDCFIAVYCRRLTQMTTRARWTLRSSVPSTRWCRHGAICTCWCSPTATTRTTWTQMTWNASWRLNRR